MSSRHIVVVDSALGTAAALSPFWWPDTLLTWLQITLACGGIFLVGLQIYHALRKKD